MTFVAAHFKESGLMLPGLLVAAELFVIQTPPWESWRISRPVWLLQVLAAELALAIRSFIPTETASGTFTAEVFLHSTMWNRLETMLTVVPEWLRLHLWPATLQADYSPQVINQATGWGVDQWLGLVIVGLIVVLAFRLRSRAPMILFGVVWVALGLFPVSNVLLPTGIPIAERTLFLSSIGAMVAVVAVGMEMIRVTAGRRRRVLQGILATAVVVITMLGASAPSPGIGSGVTRCRCGRRPLSTRPRATAPGSRSERCCTNRRQRTAASWRTGSDCNCMTDSRDRSSSWPIGIANGTPVPTPSCSIGKPLP